MERAYAAWRAFQDRILGPVAALVLVGATLLALLEVVRRYAFSHSFEWQQDAVTMFMLSAVFLYFGIVQRHNEHLTVSVVPEILQALGSRAKRAAEVVNLAARSFALVFLITVCWWGIPEIEDSIRYESRTDSLAFPMWPFLAVLLAGFAMMAVTLAFQVWFSIQKLRGRSVPEEEPKEAATAD